MAVWVVTGKLGGGKSLVSVSRIRDALAEGKKVATNLDINLVGMFGRYSRATLIRIPDKPNVHDMEAIGIGNESYDEEKNGLIVLDELGTWLNSRNWQDKSRRPLLDWFLHARKKGWDIIFIVQDVGIIDSQFRDALAEMTVFCRRLDRMTIPFVGQLYKLITGGSRLPMPRLHIGKVVYGISPSDLIIDRWIYRGTDLYSAYDTRQIFRDNYEHGPYSLLSPEYINRRFKSARTWGNVMRVTKIYWKRFRSPLALACGLLIGSAGAVAYIGKQTLASIEMPPMEAQVSKYREEDWHHNNGEDRLKAVLGTLYIRGFHNLTGTTIYELADFNDENARTLMTDQDLRNMGLLVSTNGRCRIDVHLSSEIFPIFCLRLL